MTLEAQPAVSSPDRAGEQSAATVAILARRAREAVELLIQALDRADRERDGQLLAGVDEKALVEGAVTAWIRIVLLLNAEERGLLPTGHPTYDARYSVSSLAEDLGHRVERAGEAHLQRSHDAWPRLLATFRAVAAGVALEELRLPARGGALFDPDRFPFLEGGAPELDDRTVWRMLEPHRSLAELEVEQVGEIYEGLIGCEARRADAPVIGLQGTGGTEPHVSIDALEELRDRGRAPLLAHLAQLSGRGGGAAARRTIGRALERTPTAAQLERLRAACGDEALTARVAPWASLLRTSDDGRPVVVPPGALYVTESQQRRTSGAHYTPRSLTEPLVREALAPLLSHRSAHEILELRVCDLSLGSGAFLVQVCRELADRVVDAWSAEGDRGSSLPADPDERRLHARRLVTERCLHGVDLNPTAVELAKLCLWLTVQQGDLPFTFLDHALRAGDSLLEDDTAEFDAVVGNPPWMAHAKRAAVPISDARREALRRRYPGFSAYPTTHGAFLVRAARQLRPGGRLALLLPTSVVDLDGYAGYRAAHDELCEVDPELRSIAEGAFPGVFQPCVLVTSTRRAGPAGASRGAEWSLARTDLSTAARRFLAAAATRPTLPPECFGERGLTSNVTNRGSIFRAGDALEGVPLLAGSDLQEFRVGPPSYRARASAWTRPDEVRDRYASVAVLIRQTARYPVAAVSNGTAFRNSILAGFPSDELSAEALCAWLNSAPIRWLHFMRFRDAREGMPQVKISHLRRIPAPPRERAAELHQLGARLRARPTRAARSRLDAVVFAALDVPRDLQGEIRAWVAAQG